MGRFELVARAARVGYVRVSHPAAQSRSIVPVKDPSDIRLTFELSRVLEGQVRDAANRQLVPIADLSVCEVRRRELDGTITLSG